MSRAAEVRSKDVCALSGNSNKCGWGCVAGVKGGFDLSVKAGFDLSKHNTDCDAEAKKGCRTKHILAIVAYSHKDC